MLVELEEIDAPVAVVAGLAVVVRAALARRLAAGERLVRVVDDRRQPDRREAHGGDVPRVVQHAAEVAAEVADVGRRRAGQPDRAVEGAQLGTALLRVIVGRITVDEAVRHDEVDGLGREWLERAVQVGHRRLGLDGIGRRTACDQQGGEDAAETTPCPHHCGSASLSTSSVAKPATIIEQPPMTSP